MRDETIATIKRFLSTISNKAGILAWNGKNYYLSTPNSDFCLLQGGHLGYFPNNYNNGGMGYNSGGQG